MKLRRHLLLVAFVSLGCSKLNPEFGQDTEGGGSTTGKDDSTSTRTNTTQSNTGNEAGTAPSDTSDDDPSLPTSGPTSTMTTEPDTGGGPTGSSTGGLDSCAPPPRLADTEFVYLYAHTSLVNGAMQPGAGTEGLDRAYNNCVSSGHGVCNVWTPLLFGQDGPLFVEDPSWALKPVTDTGRNCLLQDDLAGLETEIFVPLDDPALEIFPRILGPTRFWSGVHAVDPPAHCGVWDVLVAGGHLGRIGTTDAFFESTDPAPRDCTENHVLLCACWFDEGPEGTTGGTADAG